MTDFLRRFLSLCPTGVRSFTERCSRGRVVRRHLGAEFANRKVYVTPEASLSWLLPWSTSAIDRDVTEFCKEFVRPGAVVWDVGGNVGLFSFAAAQKAGKQGLVLTVEPDPFLSQLIIRSEARRPADCAPCKVITAAVSRDPGFATLEIPERSRASNALAGKSECTQIGGVRQRFDVVVVSLDQLAAQYPAPQVLKMDIEGSELDALLGGEKVLKDARPIMHLEVQSNHADRVRDLLKSWDYSLYDPAVPAASRIKLEHLAYNTLAIPN